MNDIKNYQLSCESTVDLPINELDKRNIKVLHYKYIINDKEYVDNLDDLEGFYNNIKQGFIPTTTQINDYEYMEYFKKILDEGKDIIHITFGTGMTNSYNNALMAKEELEKEYKDRDIIIINSLCSCCGYGMLVLKAYELLNCNKDINEVVNQIENIKTKIHHQFFTDDMKYFKRTGRVSGTAAFFASALKICPIMRLNHDGKIIAYNKAFGKGMAIKRTIDEMEKHCDNGIEYNDTCIIAHSNSFADAFELKNKLIAKFSNLKEKIVIYDIGKIIASHCGPGTVAVFFYGDERK